MLDTTRGGRMAPPSSGADGRVNVMYADTAAHIEILQNSVRSKEREIADLRWQNVVLRIAVTALAATIVAIGLALLATLIGA